MQERKDNFFMNNAAVDSNIKRKYQQTQFVFSKRLLQTCGLAQLKKQMQLYKDQLRSKHVSFHKEIQPAVKRMLLTSDTEND